MKIISLHKNIYKLANYACTQENVEKSLLEQKKLLGDWQALKAQKVPDVTIAKVTGISRSTYYIAKPT